MINDSARRELSRFHFGTWTRFALALPLVRKLFALERRFPAFLTLLEKLWIEQRFAEMVEVSQALRPFTRAGARALACTDPATFHVRGSASIPYTQALAAAELIGRGWIGIGQCDRNTVDTWVLPLLKKSTERYLPKTVAGHFLCVHLDHLPDPARIVSAIETDIPPRAWDDYRNFHEVFSMESWKTVRRLLTHPRIITELDRFVTRHNRTAFWSAFIQSVEV